MDNHTLSAQDLLPSDAHSDETDEIEHGATLERSAHVPPQLQNAGAHDPDPNHGHAEKNAETASLTLGAATEPLTMPEEHEVEAAAPVSPAAPVPASKPSSRNLLLGTALALTLMAGGGGFYILSHRGHAVQVATTPPLVWHPEQVTRNPADPVAALTTSPFPPPAHHAEQASGGADDILALHHESSAGPAAAALPVPVLKAVVPVVVTPPVPVVLAPPATVAAAAPPRPDPVATALGLRPAPMTPPQQVDVLSLVTQLAALVRDMRTENAQLRDKVASLDDAMKNETADVGQRLNLMEARKAIASAQDAGSPPPPAAPGSRAAVPAAVVQTVAVVPVPVAVRSVRDYRVQAASPGLAILADANAAPGQSAGLQVSVGDQVPGIGRITSIAQRGTAWVVQTNHGAIQ